MRELQYNPSAQQRERMSVRRRLECSRKTEYFVINPGQAGQTSENIPARLVLRREEHRLTSLIGHEAIFLAHHISDIPLSELIAHSAVG